MKVLFACLAVLAVASSAVIPEWEPVDIHYVKQWRDAFPELAARWPIDVDLTSNRITGGQEANRGQFRYQAVVNAGFSGGIGLCGGTLINPTWVLTAAHCTDPAAGVQSVATFLGAHNRDNLDEGEERRDAIQNILHPTWNSANLEDDVALLRVDVVPITDFIAPIAMADSGAGSFVGVTATASGWGRTGDGDGDGIPTYLQWVNLNVISNDDCSAVYGQVPSTNICTSGADGRNICSGDSGGPLAYEGQLIGVVSFGAAAGCQQGYPAGFARVSSFRGWIDSQL